MFGSKYTLFLMLLSCQMAYSQQVLQPYLSQGTGKFGYINPQTQQMTVEPQYESATPFVEKVARVQKGDRYLLLNQSGSEIPKSGYAYIGWSDDQVQDTLRVYRDLVGFRTAEGLWGLMSLKGKVKIKPRFQELDFFHEGMARVRLANDNGEGFGLIHTDGELLTDDLYAKVVVQAGDGVAFLSEKEDDEAEYVGMINAYGKLILPINYLAIQVLGNRRYAAQNSKGFWGLYDAVGNLILPHEFTEIQPFQSGKSVAAKGHLYGLLGPNGETILEFTNSEIKWTGEAFQVDPFSRITLVSKDGFTQGEFYFDGMRALGGGLYVYQAHGKEGLVDAQGKEICAGCFDAVLAQRNGLVIVQQSQHFGVIGLKGNTVLPIKFQYIHFEESGLLRGLENGGKEDLYNAQGQNLTQGRYASISEFCEGAYLVKEGDRFFFLDANLQPVAGMGNYLSASPFHLGYAEVRTETGTGLINRAGEWIIRPYFDDLQVVNEHYVIVWHGNEWATVNYRGVELSHGSGPTRLLDGGYVLFSEKGKKGLGNEFGTLVLPALYDSIGEVAPDRIVRMVRGGVVQYMDLHEYKLPEGNVFTQVKLKNGRHGNKFFPAQMGGAYGFVDYLGRVRIGPQFDDVEPFAEELAPVRLGKEWGYLTKLEKLAIQPDFEEAGPFVKGYAVVKKKGKWGLINREGKFLITNKFDRIERNDFGNYLVWEGDKIGVYNGQNFTFLYARFSALTDLGNGLAIVTLNGKQGISRLDGSTVVYPEYDRIAFNPADESFFLYKNQEVFRYF